jgi:hypothetical protein
MGCIYPVSCVVGYFFAKGKFIKDAKDSGGSTMSYEVAQQILGQLATATEIFALGYVGMNFALYAWRRSDTETKSDSGNPLLFSQQSIAQPLDLPHKPLKMPEPISNSLPTQKSLGIGDVPTEEIN